MCLMVLGFDGNKAEIINILVNERGLSAKEIFFRMRKSSGKNISYQAVHKLIINLVQKGILVKSGAQYFVNSQWLTKSKKEIEYIEQLADMRGGRVTSKMGMVFTSVYETDKFLAGLSDILLPQKEDEIGLVWIHFWIPLFMSDGTYLKMKNFILGSRFYWLTPNNTKIDKWCAEFWKKLGVKEKVGVKDFSDTSMLVYKDTIVQVFYPTDIRKALDKVYNSTDNISKLDIDNFFKTVFEKKTRIPVLISRDEEVATELMKQIKSNF